MRITNGMTAVGEWNKIVTRKGDDDREKYEMGAAYNNIVTFKLAEEAGYKSARDFFTDMLKQAAEGPATIDGLKVRELSRSTLANYGLVAKLFEADDFVAYGYTNLFLFQRYRKLAGVAPSVPLAQATVKVPSANGSSVEKPLRECSTRDLQSAMRALRPHAEPLPEGDQETIELLNVAVDVVVGTERRCDVSARQNKDEVLVSIKDVPLHQLEETLWSMLEVLPKR